MSAHTPGPWTVEVHDIFTNVEAPMFTVAADVSNDDARLIAAAPDLLAALKGIMDYAATGARVSDVDTTEQPQFVNAYAALAKAEAT